MTSSKTSSDIFKAGSTTYYYASRFFPKQIRNDVAAVYAFVRVLDDYVDQVPQDVEGFEAHITDYRKETSERTVNKRFKDVARRQGFEQEWVDAFFESMRMDIDKHVYQDFGELKTYIYGSAEVIGLMMTRIMGVSEEYDDEAAMLGRAMQYINMIRDIGFDQDLGRTYIPQTEIMNAGLTGLEEHEARRHPEKFKSLVREEIHRYKEWSREGRSALHALPGPCRVAVKTASDMYNWTADALLEDPFKVYETPLKPSRARVLLQGGKNTLPWY